MSGVTSAIKRWAADYAGAALLALLLHALLMACLLRLEFTQMPLPKPAEPVVSYLYQPPPVPAVAAQAENTPPEPAPAALPTELSAAAKPEVSALASVANPVTKADVLSEKQPATLVVPSVAEPEQHNSGLAQRALSTAATPSARAIEDAAAASYQQFLQAQQQPKMIVEKRHQELNADPAQQIVAQLDDGKQLIRTKGGCRIADPTKDGFDGLMAARMVPCGDEANTSDLLKQALEKHLKR
ncbi:hypothetical protein M2404_002674 [Rheinheimera pacifica]|uniref:hypothetical protein n=1 Tax=Rheinheimera pacifica TaxID=173990 RepID=UPI00216AB1AF|nr:hypothetical protein [Rheinheimera pacifica]MCS4308319.1 hypothetical protein [Rheinheimera pacifica]